MCKVISNQLLDARCFSCANQRTAKKVSHTRSARFKVESKKKSFLTEFSIRARGCRPAFCFVHSLGSLRAEWEGAFENDRSTLEFYESVIRQSAFFTVPCVRFESFLSVLFSRAGLPFTAVRTLPSCQGERIYFKRSGSAELSLCRLFVWSVE